MKGMRDLPVTRILAELEADTLLPGILFRTSRRQCDEDVERLSKSKIGLLAEKEQLDLKDDIHAISAKYQIDAGLLQEHPHYRALISTGAGAHHAGQLLQWRILLEELMSKGSLRLLIATGTVAAGVDFPARSVIVTAHSRRGAEGFMDLSPSEFQQMSGRAGRRGKDSVGICLVAPGQYCDARVIHDISRKPPEPLRSAYFASPSTVLNLLKFRSVEELKFTVARSLAVYSDRKEAVQLREQADQAEQSAAEEGLPDRERKKREKRARRINRQADDLAARQESQLQLALEGLEGLGYLKEDKLTPKGGWAAELCTSLVLQLAEAIEEGIFYDLSSDELATSVGSIAGDGHRTYFSLAPNPLGKELYGELEAVVERVQEKYQGPNTTADLEVVPNAGLTVHTWMHSESWNSFASLLRLGGVAEGDAARVITQTADHLHQISRLMESHPDLARTALEARSVLLRPPLSDAFITVDE